MSATEEFRCHLEETGIKYGKLGDYTTYVTSRGFSWTLTDNYDGTVAASVNRATPDEAIALVTERHGHAVKKNVYYGDGVGHTECTACGRTVSLGSSYCSWCGVRFSGIVSEVR